MRRRSAIIIASLAVSVLAVVGASMLFAAPSQDHITDERLDEAVRALGVLNEYFHYQHYRATPPPTLSLSPASTSTSTLAPPTPALFPVPLEGCRQRESGKLSRYGPVNVSAQVSRHMEVVFTNPEDRWWGWEYGFKLQEDDTSSIVGKIPVYSFIAHHDGSWTVYSMSETVMDT